MRSPAPRLSNNHGSALRASSFVSTAVSDLFSLGVIALWTLHPDFPSQNRPTIVSPLSVATRASGAQRLVIDLSYLNEHLAKEPFKYESLSMLSDILEPGFLIFNLDLKSG